MNCKNCQKPTNVVCHRCGDAICPTHAYPIRKRFFCADCFYHERKIGLIKAWGAIFGLLIVAIVIIKLRT